MNITRPDRAALVYCDPIWRFCLFNSCIAHSDINNYIGIMFIINGKYDRGDKEQEHRVRATTPQP